MKKILAVTLLALLGTGCATNSSYTYQDHRSEAFNIAHAGGLVKGIRDAEVPADEFGSLTETALKTGFVGAGYLKPQLGMTNWQTMGVNLLAELTEPDSHGARNSLVAWMPMSEAGSTQEAQTALLSHVKEAVSSTLGEFGAEQEIILENSGAVVVHFIKGEWGCPEYQAGITTLQDICRVNIRVFEPHTSQAPSFLGTSDQRYRFSSEHGRKYHRVSFKVGKTSPVPQDILYAKISKVLPAWAYLYLAPGQVVSGNGEVNGYPYILKKGEAKLFVIPKG